MVVWPFFFKTNFVIIRSKQFVANFEQWVVYDFVNENTEVYHILLVKSVYNCLFYSFLLLFHGIKVGFTVLYWHPYCQYNVLKSSTYIFFSGKLPFCL